MKAGFNVDVRPDVIKEAKNAAKAQVTVVINSKMADINKHVAIPVYGIATLKSWMEKSVEPVAIKEATKKGVCWEYLSFIMERTRIAKTPYGFSP